MSTAETVLALRRVGVERTLAFLEKAILTLRGDGILSTRGVSILEVYSRRMIALRANMIMQVGCGYVWGIVPTESDLLLGPFCEASCRASSPGEGHRSRRFIRRNRSRQEGGACSSCKSHLPGR